MQLLKTVLVGTAAALVLALARPSFGADLQPAPLPPAEPATSGANALPAPVTHSELPPPSNGALSSGARANAASPSGRARRTPHPVVDAHIGDTVAKAISEAHIGDVVARALNDAHIEEAVAKATDDARISEKVSAALAKAHIHEKIAAAMKAAQPRIDAAIAKAERAAQEAQEAAPAVQAAPAVEAAPAVQPTSPQ